MRVTSHKIPATLTFPGAYKILIRNVSKEFMEGLGWGDADAVWNSEDMTIYLRKDMSFIKKKHDLLHELEHAWVDAKLELERKWGLSGE